MTSTRRRAAENTGNVICPVLIITREEMDRAIDIIDEAIGEVELGKKY